MQEKNYSLEELQNMLMEMAQGFDLPPLIFNGPSIFEGDSRCSKRTRLETNPMVDRAPSLHVSTFGVYGASGFCWVFLFFLSTCYIILHPKMCTWGLVSYCSLEFLHFLGKVICLRSQFFSQIFMALRKWWSVPKSETKQRQLKWNVWAQIKTNVTQ